MAIFRGEERSLAKRGYVYMMMNPGNTVLYTGVTSNLWSRVAEHKEKTVEGFTKRYNVIKLVWFEEFVSISEAIAAEKKIKSGSRARKMALIQSLNPGLKELMP
ncbi:MAG: GIY-YIG nuclease family protein [Geobacteraceae bacterium]|nr:GIY-YIG nuclease family protein [Geobacteraceae bacterium]